MSFSLPSLDSEISVSVSWSGWGLSKTYILLNYAACVLFPKVLKRWYPIRLPDHPGYIPNASRSYGVQHPRLQSIISLWINPLRPNRSPVCVTKGRRETHWSVTFGIRNLKTSLKKKNSIRKIIRTALVKLTVPAEAFLNFLPFGDAFDLQRTWSH